MPVEQWHMDKAVELAKQYGATRVVLFGSAVDSPETARDLDIACAGIEGRDFWQFGADVREALPTPVDVVWLSPGKPFTAHAERWEERSMHLGKLAEERLRGDQPWMG